MKRDILKKIVPVMFDGIHPDWLKLITSDKLKKHFNYAVASVNDYLVTKGVTVHHIDKNGINVYIRPGIERVLEFMKYCRPSEVKAIIVGQDPYPDPVSACGLAFAAQTGAPLPRSLANIFETLNQQKLISRPVDNCDTSLVAWAKQGILLINRYLTRSPNIKCVGEPSQDVAAALYIDGNGDKKNMHTEWALFTSALIRELIDMLDNNVPLLLWGNEAAEIIDELGESKEKARIMRWQHPSPSVPGNNKNADPKSFRNCDHFVILAREYGINWDPNVNKPKKRTIMAAETTVTVTTTASSVDTLAVTMADSMSWRKTPIIVSCDGSCKDNGGTNPKAGYGIFWPAKFRGEANLFQSRHIFGRVPERTTKITAAVPNCVFGGNDQLIVSDRRLECTNNPAAPTNNRGELLGGIYALMHILHKMPDKLPPVTMVFDSTYVLLIITERIWKWHNISTTFVNRPNADLLIVLYDLLVEMAERYSPGCGPELAQTILIHPARQADGNSVVNLTHDEIDWNWKAVTCVYQRSHQSDIGLTGIAAELHAFNKVADELGDKGAFLPASPTAFAPQISYL